MRKKLGLAATAAHPWPNLAELLVLQVLRTTDAIHLVASAAFASKQKATSTTRAKATSCSPSVPLLAVLKLHLLAAPLIGIVRWLVFAYPESASVTHGQLDLIAAI